MVEQPVIGQAITQDFLGILLKKLSENSQPFIVQGDGLKEKDPEKGNEQDDQAIDAEGNQELASLLHILALWNNNTVRQTEAVVPEDGDETGEPRAYAAVPDMPNLLQESIGSKKEACHSCKPDEAPERIVVQDDMQDVFPDTMTSFLQVAQAVMSGQNLRPSRQEMAAEDARQAAASFKEIPVNPVLNRKAADTAIQDFAIPVEAEENNDTGLGLERQDDFMVLFRRQEAGTTDRREASKGFVIPNEPLPIPPDDAQASEKIPFLTAEKDFRPISPDDRQEKVRAVPRLDEEHLITRYETNLLQRGDHFKTEVVHGKDGLKVFDKMVTGSIIADRVEQVVEQYAAKNSSLDMVVRLKIDEKETILVGLKDDGHKISVQIKTGNEGTMNLIQSQKDVITRHLEGKNIYTTILVDINDQRGFEKRDRHNRQDEKDQEKNEGDFSAFLDALA